MAGNIKGITVEIGGSTTKLVAALRDVDKEIRGTQKELREIEKLLKLDPKDTELLAQKQRALGDAITETKDRLTKLQEAQKQAKQQLESGKLGQDKYDALRREIIKTEDKLKDLATEAANANTALSKIGNVGSVMQKAGGVMSSAGKTLTTYATVPIMGLGAAAVAVGADFDESMSKVKAISGATGEDFEKLRDKAREMGSKTKFSAKEAADAMVYMSMAGWNTNKVLDGIDGVMALAASSGEDLARTSDIVTDAMSAFGLEAKDAGHFSDILAAASNNANTNVGLLGESFQYIATSAGTYKFSAEDTAVALGLMANAGIKGTQAGTSLKNALVNLTKPTDAQIEAMQQLGLMTTEYVTKIDSNKVSKAQNAVEKATLTLQTAQARYNEILKQQGQNSTAAITAHNNVEKAQVKVTDATKALKDAQDNYNKAVKEYGANSKEAQTAHQKVEAAQSKLKTATLNLNTAQEKYNKVLQSGSADSPKVVAARNAVEKAEISLQEAQDKLTKAQEGTTKAVAGQNLLMSDADGNVRDLDSIIRVLRAALGDTNVELLDSEGNLKDFDAVLQEAADHGADLTQIQKLQAAATIFGKQNMSGMLAIINASQEDYDKLSNSVKNCTYNYDAMSKGLEDAGIATDEWMGAFKDQGLSASEVYQSLAKDITKYLADAGGDAEQAFQRLMGVISQDGDMTWHLSEEQARQAIDVVKCEMDSFAGTAKETAETMQDNLKGQLTILKSALQELALQISDAVTPKIRGIVETVQSVIEKLQGMDESTKNSIIRWALFAAAVGPLLLVFGKLTSGIGAVVTGIANVGKGVLGLVEQAKLGVGAGAKIASVFQTLTSGPIAAIIVAVAALAAGFIYLWETNEDFRKKVTEIWEKVRVAFQRLYDFIEKLLTALAPVFEAAVAVLKTIWDKFCNALAPIIEGVFTAIAGILQGAVDVLSGILDVFIGLFTGDWDTFWNGIKKIFEGVWEAMKGVFEGLRTIWSGILNNFFRTLSTVWETGWNAIKATGEMIWNMISSVFENIWWGLSTIVETVLKTIVSAISFAFDGIATVFSTVWGGIKSGFTDIWDAIKDYVEVTLLAIGSLIDAAFKIITVPFMLIWENCKEGIIEAWDKIKSGVSESLDLIAGLIEKIWDGISKWLIKCVSEIYESVTSSWEKIKDGVNETCELLSGLIEKVWTGISDWLSLCAETIWKAITDSWNKIKDGINNTCELISGLIERIWTGISNWFSGCLDGIYGYMSGCWDNIKTYTSSVWDGIKDYFLGIWDSIKDGVTTRVSNMWEAIKSPFTTAYDWIANQLQRIRDLFSFEWSLPKIKLPHFKIEGKFSLAPPSVPTLSIEWYKKAMDDAYILNSPTIFGAVGNKLLGGGEAGSEAIVGTNKLADIVRDAILSVSGNSGTTIIPVYIGNERIEEIVVRANNSVNYRSGGR